MNVYIITGFTGHHPVGTAAVVVAPDEASAREMLNTTLAAQGLPPTDKPFQRLPLTAAYAAILCNGDY